MTSVSVEHIDEAPAELKAKGVPLLDPVPRIGHAGCRIAFLDGRNVIELAELPADQVASRSGER